MCAYFACPAGNPPIPAGVSRCIGSLAVVRSKTKTLIMCTIDISVWCVILSR
jgi:hypothetical protein